MSELHDKSEWLAVNRLDLLMRTYRMSSTPEGSSELLISAYADSIAARKEIKTEEDVKETCAAFREELVRYLKQFIAERETEV